MPTATAAPPEEEVEAPDPPALTLVPLSVLAQFRYDGNWWARELPSAAQFAEHGMQIVHDGTEGAIGSLDNLTASEIAGLRVLISNNGAYRPISTRRYRNLHYALSDAFEYRVNPIQFALFTEAAGYPIIKVPSYELLPSGITDPQCIKIGIELEYDASDGSTPRCDGMESEFHDFDDRLTGWSGHHDGSVTGGEMVSPPMKADAYEQTELALQVLADNGAIATPAVGIHVHLDVSTDEIQRDTKVYPVLCGNISVIEPDLYRLLPPSRRRSSFARPLPPLVRSQLLAMSNDETMPGVVCPSSAQRYQSFNFGNIANDSEKKTIECRALGNTLNPDNIIPWMKLLRGIWAASIDLVKMYEPEDFTPWGVMLHEKGYIDDHCFDWMLRRIEQFSSGGTMEFPDTHNQDDTHHYDSDDDCCRCGEGWCSDCDNCYDRCTC